MSDADDLKGVDWDQTEIDLVVADYFAMRALFLKSQPFVKARHYEKIVELTGRSKGSVERKYMNISAVLERLSLPWLKGYAPNPHFQGALVTAVEQFVEREWHDEIATMPQVNGIGDAGKLFIDSPPDLTAPSTSKIPELERMARKFDPALRDQRN